MSNSIDLAASLRSPSNTDTAMLAEQVVIAGSRLVRRVRALLLVGLFLMLAGCASRPESVLAPVTSTTGDASRVDMLVATTRQATDNPGLLYSGERGTAIALNRLVVSIPPDRSRKIGEVQWPRRVPPDPGRDFAVLNVETVSSEQQVLQWFRKKKNAKRQAIIFVHGFNYTYADAVFRFAQITHDAGVDAAPILFTWPSRASVLDYFYDKESLTYSRRALEDLIIQAARSPDVGEITILAHSMGTWLTTEALRGVAMREHTIPSKVNNVILASPDIDVDVFRRQLIEMGPKRPHFTIFSSTTDKALEVSRWISGGVNRVGGTDAKPYLGDLKQLGITVIDTSNTASNDPLRHTAFADSPEVIALLGKQLAGQTQDIGNVTLGEQLGMTAIGTVNLARSAARTVVTAPMSVINSGSRNVFQKKLSDPTPHIVDGKIPY